MGAGVNEGYMFSNMGIEAKQMSHTVKTVYRYGEKKHLVEMLIRDQAYWVVVNLKKQLVDVLEVESDSTNKKNTCRKIKFTNKKVLRIPYPDPDNQKPQEMPSYAKKPLNIEFAFDARSQIEALLANALKA